MNHKKSKFFLPENSRTLRTFCQKNISRNKINVNFIVADKLNSRQIVFYQNRALNEAKIMKKKKVKKKRIATEKNITTFIKVCHEKPYFHIVQVIKNSFS